ncbi:MAG: endonuclease NucS [Actinomycetota bacterium]
MRLLIARCAVEYQGRLGARLAPAIRLIMCKADGSIAIHSDSKAYKPLNWMNPPCVIEEADGVITARTSKGETLRIELHDVVQDVVVALGVDPGLEKDGAEAELQQLLAAQIDVLGTDLTLITREYPTDIGPVDLLCCDSDGHTIVVEVKRVGEIASVEQLLRYQERLDRDPRFAPTAGVLVAQAIKPHARVFAEGRGVTCVEIDLDVLRGTADPSMTLF